MLPGNHTMAYCRQCDTAIHNLVTSRGPTLESRDELGPKFSSGLALFSMLTSSEIKCKPLSQPLRLEKKAMGTLSPHTNFQISRSFPHWRPNTLPSCDIASSCSHNQSQCSRSSILPLYTCLLICPLCIAPWCTTHPHARAFT